MSAEELKQIIRENVRSRRIEKDKTQSQLAQSIGTSQAYIANIERGHTSVSVEMLAKIAEALDTQPAAILTKDAFTLAESSA